jgi:hypothetical protein
MILVGVGGAAILGTLGAGAGALIASGGNNSLCRQMVILWTALLIPFQPNI